MVKTLLSDDDGERLSDGNGKKPATARLSGPRVIVGHAA